MRKIQMLSACCAIRESDNVLCNLHSATTHIHIKTTNTHKQLARCHNDKKKNNNNEKRASNVYAQITHTHTNE